MKFLLNCRNTDQSTDQLIQSVCTPRTIIYLLALSDQAHAAAFAADIAVNVRRTKRIELKPKV